MRTLIAASVIALAFMPSAANAQTNHSVTVADCSGTEITIKDLADGACTPRIPTPTERPKLVKNEALDSAQRVERDDFRYMQTPNPETGAVRTVRIVGTPFLPEDNESIEFDRQATLMINPVDATLRTLASAFGITTAMADTPKQPSNITVDNRSAEMQRLKENANARILMAHAD